MENEQQANQINVQAQGGQTVQSWAGDPQQNPHTQGACPACGYCPCCGRGGHYTVPYMPSYSYPYCGPTWTITQGGNPVTGATEPSWKTGIGAASAQAFC